ncbi:cysteine desulfurase, SufS family protein [Chlamydia pecorum]|uniref:Cysteine desulfurase n=1 Tax=Chlamydia pecorum TaxID=85991 RepID=A0AA40PRB3_9CHLA|nr:SufS family cysteine desulfurase [Chlamydia pecorum]KTF29118.1 cysteine desulfurase, SufS family protein [Chlamydia pecorum]
MREIKKDFPIFASKEKNGESFIYLDSAATTHKPQDVLDALIKFYTTSYASVGRSIYSSSREASQEFSLVRQKIRDWLGAAFEEEIVFTRGTTAGLNTLAIAVNDLWSSGGVVLVSETEHHANVISWEIACRRRGSSVKKISVLDSGLIDLNHLEDLLKEGANLVSIPGIHNVSGGIQPIKEIAALVHRYHAWLAVDGAQSIGHQPVDVRSWDVDFYVFSSHKVYGPTGLGVLYGKKELLELLPPVEGGGGMVEIYDPQDPKYLPSPLKFEAGTPHVAGVVGLGAALDYLNKLSPEAIYSHEAELIAYMHEQLVKNIPGLHVLGPELGFPRGGLLSMKIDQAHPLDLGVLLDLQGIAVRTGHLCSQPSMARWGTGHVLRASLGVYNDKHDIDTFICALQDAVAQLRR